MLDISGVSFDDCPDLRSITVAEGNTTYRSASDCLIKTAAKELIVGSVSGRTPADGSVTAIGSGAFQGRNVTAIAVPEGIVSIGNMAFSGCNKLTVLSLPASLQTIQNTIRSITDSCENLTTLTVAPDNEVFAGAGNCVIERASGTLILGCKSSVIPKDGSVVRIKENAFYSVGQITEITVPASVVTIERRAFSSSDLQSVVFEGTTGWQTSEESMAGSDLNVSDASVNADRLRMGCEMRRSAE